MGVSQRTTQGPEPHEDLFEVLVRVGNLETGIAELLEQRESEVRLLSEWASTIQSLQLELAALSSWRTEITSAVAEGIQRVDRSERRIKATVRRAKAQLASLGLEDEGIDAEARELGIPDDDGGGARRLPPVQEAVVDPENAPSSVPGVTQGQLRRARGYL